MRVAITGGSGFIGTNLVQRFLERGDEVLNLDLVPPRQPAHRPHWTAMDLVEGPRLSQALSSFQPEALLHFGARTDLDEIRSLDGYAANIQGVENVLAAIRSTPSLRRVVFTSSQLVCRIGYRPAAEDDYCPSTLYGESKRVGETLVRQAKDLAVTWTLVRPTSIWGPWFGVPYRNFFEAIATGRYVHPGGVTTPKQWGYVGNAVFEVEQLLAAPADAIHGKTFYLADFEPVDLRRMADLIQREMGVRPIPTVPAGVLRAAARAGDLLQVLGWKSPPLTSFRYRNITTPELQDLTPLAAATGPLPYSVEAGVAATVRWLRSPEAGARRG